MGGSDEGVPSLIDENRRRDEELVTLHNQFGVHEARLGNIEDKLEELVAMVRKLSTSTTSFSAPSSNPLAPSSSNTNVTNTAIPIGSAPLRDEYMRNQAARAKAPYRGAARVPIPPNTTSFQQVYEEDEEEEEEAARHDERVVNTNIRGRDDIKVDISSYDGGEDPEEFIDWCRMLERIFECKGFGEEKMFQVAVMKLTKYASLWYDGFKHTRQRKGKHKISTWQELKKQMTKRFVPFDYRKNVFLRLNDLMQGNSSVSSYVHEFEKLQMICGLDEQEEMMIARFVRGLERSIRSKLDLHL